MGHVSHTGGKFKINQAGCSDAHCAAHLFFQCPLVASLKPHEKCKHGDAVEPCVCARSQENITDDVQVLLVVNKLYFSLLSERNMPSLH